MKLVNATVLVYLINSNILLLCTGLKERLGNDVIMGLIMRVLIIDNSDTITVLICVDH